MLENILLWIEHDDTRWHPNNFQSVVWSNFFVLFGNRSPICEHLCHHRLCPVLPRRGLREVAILSECFIFLLWRFCHTCYFFFYLFWDDARFFCVKLFQPNVIRTTFIHIASKWCPFGKNKKRNGGHIKTSIEKASVVVPLNAQDLRREPYHGSPALFIFVFNHWTGWSGAQERVSCSTFCYYLLFMMLLANRRRKLFVRWGAGRRVSWQWNFMTDLQRHQRLYLRTWLSQADSYLHLFERLFYAVINPLGYFNLTSTATGFLIRHFVSGSTPAFPTLETSLCVFYMT